MVDGESAVAGLTAGQELVDALIRRGRPARYIDADAIDEELISRGWPTERQRRSWAGEIVVVDTSNIASDAHRVALATRTDAVVLARSTTDDARMLRRLVELLKSEGVDIAVTALFPPRPAFVAVHQ